MKSILQQVRDVSLLPLTLEVANVRPRLSAPKTFEEFIPPDLNPVVTIDPLGMMEKDGLLFVYGDIETYNEYFESMGGVIVKEFDIEIAEDVKILMKGLYFTPRSEEDLSFINEIKTIEGLVLASYQNGTVGLFGDYEQKNIENRLYDFECGILVLNGPTSLLWKVFVFQNGMFGQNDTIHEVIKNFVNQVNTSFNTTNVNFIEQYNSSGFVRECQNKDEEVLELTYITIEPPKPSETGVKGFQDIDGKEYYGTIVFGNIRKHHDELQRLGGKILKNISLKFNDDLFLITEGYYHDGNSSGKHINIQNKTTLFEQENDDGSISIFGDIEGNIQFLENLKPKGFRYNSQLLLSAKEINGLLYLPVFYFDSMDNLEQIIQYIIEINTRLDQELLSNELLRDEALTSGIIPDRPPVEAPYKIMSATGVNPSSSSSSSSSASASSVSASSASSAIRPNYVIGKRKNIVRQIKDRGSPKTVDIFLSSNKALKNMKAGDIIKYCDDDNQKICVNVKVIYVKEYQSFRELIQAEGLKQTLPQSRDVDSAVSFLENKVFTNRTQGVKPKAVKFSII